MTEWKWLELASRVWGNVMYTNVWVTDQEEEFFLKGACTSGLKSGVKRYVFHEPGTEKGGKYGMAGIDTFKLPVISYREVIDVAPGLLPEEVDAYLKAIDEWGFGKFEARQHWIAKGEETNITRWFIQHHMLRYLWEYPLLIARWYQWVYHFPDLDKWALYVMAHQRVDWQGHTLMYYGFPAIRVGPQAIAAQYMEVTGFDWSKVAFLWKVFTRYDLSAAVDYGKQINATNWKQYYDKYVALPLST